MTAIQDPVITVEELLADNWNAGNTSIGYDPDIHTGWHSDDADSPQVTVTNPEESPLGGGETGFSAMDGAGGGAVQELSGTVNVDCWSDRDVEGGVNPKKLTYEFTEEVKRIVDANRLTATDLRLIAYLGRAFVPPGSEEHPPAFRYNCPINYLYESRP